MRLIRERIFNKEIPNTSSNKKGCVAIELFNKIEIANYVHPVLHAEIGIGNYFLNSFFEWIDYRVEEIGEEEREKRNLHGNNLKEKYKLEDEWEIWKINEGAELIDKRNSRRDYNNMKTLKDDDNKFIHTAQERKDLTKMATDLTSRIKELQKEKKVLDSKLKLQRKIVEKLKGKFVIFIIYLYYK